MTPLEKVEKYVNEHVGPFTIEKIANYYLIGKTSVRMALNKLHHENKLTRKKIGNTAHFYKPKHTVIVALPPKVVAVSNPTTYNRPIQNSYPSIRGYDD